MQLPGQLPENRKYENANQALEGFQGIFHSDKYEAYEKIAKKIEIIWQPCWVHLRRYFEEAKFGDPEFRKTILRKIRYLFMLERVTWARSPEERLKIHREKETPIIDEMIELVKSKVKSQDFLPKSILGKAIGYFYGLIPHLKNYHQNANDRLDNNVAERALRYLAIGRKNWLFFGSNKGGKAASVLLSLVQTCRALEIHPQEYLEDIMHRFYDYPANRLSELLPAEWAKARAEKNPASATKPIHMI